ncbi:hypothetical protein [Corynebacterium stationis]|uniref:hypothetical protein n=1 Tax=Corynebacterium stationis TaxID=1705 RepID=UPI0024B05B18|nr:hypothetical protein [Corynebacterium stationis]
MSTSNTDIMLAPGESGLYSRSFRPNLLLFWLRDTYLVTNKRLALKCANTIFGFIPLGFEEKSIPMGSIAGVNSSFKVKPVRLLFAGFMAAVMLFMGLSALAGGAVGGLFLLLAGTFFAAIAANSIMASLSVTNKDGGVNEVTVSILDKAALDDFKNKATEYIYSASAGGISWQQAYASNSEGFQNSMGQPQGHIAPQSHPAQSEPTIPPRLPNQGTGNSGW